MKSIWFFSIIILSVQLSAQQAFNLDVKLRSGLELNILKATSQNKSLKDTNRIIEIENGFFHSMTINPNWRLKIGKHRILFDADFVFDHYPTLARANQFRHKIKFQYRYKPKKNHSLYLSGSYKNYRSYRSTDFIEDQLGQREHSKYLLYVKYLIYFSKATRISFKLTGANSRFLNQRNNLYSYREIAFEVMWRQKIFSSNNINHFFSIKTGGSHRDYINYSLENVSDPSVLNIRDWRYYSVDIQYNLKFRKIWDLQFGIAIKERQDHTLNKYGYHYYRPYFKVNGDFGEIEISWRNSVGQKNYNSIKASDGFSELLVQRYLNSSLTINFQTNSKTETSIGGTFYNRSRNYLEGADSFLPYSHAKVWFVLKYKI